MVKLGDNILDKIQDLILQIDRPRSPKQKGKKGQSNKYNNRTHTHINNYQQSENIPGKRLYQDHKKSLKKAHQRQKQKMYQQVKEVRDFKVSNKHSIFLNSQVKRKPIYQRINEIVQEREKSLLAKRIQRQEKQDQIKNQDENEIKKWQKAHPTKKVTKKQAEQIFQGLRKKQLERLQRINIKKMENMRQKALQSTEKPKINDESKKIWEKKQINRCLSNNIIQRFQQYGWQKKMKQQEFRQQIRVRQTPFKPKISQNSRVIVQNLQRSPLHSDLSRSTSCKCFRKVQKHDKSLKASRDNQSHVNSQYLPDNSNVAMNANYYLNINNNQENSNVKYQKSVSTHYGNGSRYMKDVGSSRTYQNNYFNSPSPNKSSKSKQSRLYQQYHNNNDSIV